MPRYLVPSATHEGDARPSFPAGFTLTEGQGCIGRRVADGRWLVFVPVPIPTPIPNDVQPVGSADLDALCAAEGWDAAAVRSDTMFGYREA